MPRPRQTLFQLPPEESEQIPPAQIKIRRGVVDIAPERSENRSIISAVTLFFAIDAMPFGHCSAVYLIFGLIVFRKKEQHFWGLLQLC